MATDVLLEVKFRSLSGNTDDPTTAWAFHAGAGDVDVTAVQAAIESFYNTAASGATNAVCYYLGTVLDRTSNAATSTYYDIAGHLNGTPHGPPINVDFWTLGAASGNNNEPAQLAVVAEHNADLSGVPEFGTGTRPRSRLRGRHYHGPLAQDAIQVHNSSPWDANVTSVFLADLKAAYTAFLASFSSGTEWCVWTRKGAALNPIIGGWLDNTVHVQRRRQDPSGVKTVWP